MDVAHLRNQFAHVLGTGAGGSLIGHCRHPLHHPGLEQPVHAHQHQADSAVAADVIPDTLRKRFSDHVEIDRIEDDHGILPHAQRRRGIDPVAVPAVGAQLRVDVVGVFAALAGNDHFHCLEFLQVGSIPERRHVLADIRALASGLRGGEQNRIDVIEIVLLAHPLHQHRTDHAAPADQSHSSDRGIRSGAARGNHRRFTCIHWSIPPVIPATPPPRHRPFLRSRPSWSRLRGCRRSDSPARARA